MLELTFTPSTVVIVALIAVGIVFAIRRLTRKGLCDCNEKCGDKGQGGCSHCGAASDMVKRMEAAAETETRAK